MNGRLTTVFAIAIACVLPLIGHAARADGAQAGVQAERGAPDFRAKAPSAGPPVTPVIPPIREARLTNGIRVLVIERHALPIVAIHVVSSYGAAQVAPGIARFASAAASLSTDRIGSKELVTGFSSIGAEQGEEVDLDAIGISAKCLNPRVDRVAELLAAITFTASFDDEDVERVRAILLHARHEATRRSVELAVAQALYPASHPFHDRLWGPEETIVQAKPRDLQNYWRKAFVPARMTIAVVGDVYTDAVVSILESRFGDIKGDASKKLAPLAPIAVPSPSLRANIVLIDKPGETQAKVAVGAIGPAAGTDDEYAMRFADELLGNRLRWNLRETNGITYGIGAGLDAHRSFGEFSVDGAIETDRTGEALARILAEIDRLSTEDIAPEAMAALKNHRVYRTPALFGNLNQTAGALAHLSVRGFPLDTWANGPARVEAVTAPQVQALARSYLRSEALTIVIAGDARKIVPQLEERHLGPVRIVR